MDRRIVGKLGEISLFRAISPILRQEGVTVQRNVPIQVAQSHIIDIDILLQYKDLNIIIEVKNYSTAKVVVGGFNWYINNTCIVSPLVQTKRVASCLKELDPEKNVIYIVFIYHEGIIPGVISREDELIRTLRMYIPEGG